jgi:hypothetical protein
MEQINRKFTATIIVFTIGMLLSLLTLVVSETRILSWGLLAVSLTYLIMGWYLFKTYFPEGHPILLFLMGYLYSGIFIAFVFYSVGWPLANVIMQLAPLWALIQFILLFMIRKKMPQKGLIQFFIEAGLLLLLSIVLLARTL